MKKFVAVLLKSESVSMSAFANAIGHTVAGLAGQSVAFERTDFVDYKDADSNVYPHISKWPFVVLKGNQSKIKAFRQQLRDAALPHTCFLDSMMTGGSDAQVAQTLEKKESDLQILCVTTFGDAAAIDPLTRKFSLWC